MAPEGRGRALCPARLRPGGGGRVPGARAHRTRVGRAHAGARPAPRRTAGGCSGCRQPPSSTRDCCCGGSFRFEDEVGGLELTICPRSYVRLKLESLGRWRRKKKEAVSPGRPAAAGSGAEGLTAEAAADTPPRMATPVRWNPGMHVNQNSDSVKAGIIYNFILKMFAFSYFSKNDFSIRVNAFKTAFTV